MQTIAPVPLEAFLPSAVNASGANCFVQSQMKIFFSTDGASVIDLKVAPVLLVAFGLPATTPEDFFNPVTIVANFAQLLGVDASKIRRVEIVRANRRRRSASDQLNYIKIIIEENASADLTNTAALDAQKASIAKLDATIANLFITNELQTKAQTLLNVTIASLAVQNPQSNTTATAVAAQANIVVDIKVWYT